MSQFDEHSITVSATTDQLSNVRSFVAEFASDVGFPESEIDKIKLAVDEAFTNIVKHGYGSDDEKWVSLKTGFSDRKIWISISDGGKPYDPNHYSEPNIPQRVKEGKRGGVGIYLIKKLMDKVEYSTIDNINELKLIKKL